MASNCRILCLYLKASTEPTKDNLGSSRQKRRTK